MMTLYRKVSQKTWGDRKFRGLSDDAKLIWIFILTGPHTNGLPGIYAVTPHSIAAGLGWDFSRADQTLNEIEQAGMIENDGVSGVIYTPNFLKYHPLGSEKNLTSWIRSFNVLPESHLQETWLEATESAYAESGNLAIFQRVISAEYAPSDGPSDGPSDAPSDGPSDVERERERERDKERDKEKDEDSVGDFASTLSPPLVPVAADQGRKAFEAWAEINEAKAVQLDVPPGVFASMALRLLEEFQLFYDQNSKGARMTDGKMKQFVKRVMRLDPINAMVGMEIFIDGYGGKKDWPYCAKIMTNQTQLSEKERDRDLTRHRGRHRDSGVWHEITTALAERKHEEVQHGNESLRLAEGR